MKKLFATIIFISVVLPLSAATRGMCGDNIAWLLRDGVLTISGDGDMYDYKENSPAPYSSNKDNIKKVVFSGGVKKIGAFAFYKFESLEEIEFNEGLESIRRAAFSGCSSIKELSFPSSMEMVTSYSYDESQNSSTGAFSHCTSLHTVTLNENLTKLGCASFFGCTSLKTINWNSIYCAITNGYYLDYYNPDQCTFNNCPIESVIFGEKATRISENTFIGIKTLKNVVTPDNLEYIGSNAFSNTEFAATQQPEYGMWYIGKTAYSYIPESPGNNSIAIVDIPEGITGISGNAFSRYSSLIKDGTCKPISELTLPSTLKYIANTQFRDFQSERGKIIWKCKDIPQVIEERTGTENTKYKYIFQNMLIDKLILPEGMETIPRQFFAGIKKINTVTLPSTLKEIEYEGFYDSEISNMTLPDNLEKIGGFALMNGKMEELTIPNSTKYIEYRGIDLEYCRKLTMGENATSQAPIRINVEYPYLTELIWNAIDLTPEKGFIPNAASYSKTNENKIDVTFGDKVKVIPPSLLAGIKNELKISGGKSITTISERAFFGSIGLTAIDLPESLKSIHENAFSKSGLESIIIPQSVETMHPEAFAECPLEQVIVACPTPPADGAKLGYYANELVAPIVYVPDTEAYKSWLPAVSPMLKNGDYYLGDGLTENLQITSNIPGYQAETDYKFDVTTPGNFTATIPVTFNGEKTFRTTVKYSYTINDGVSSTTNAEIQHIKISKIDNAIVISGDYESVSVFDISGKKIYEGNDNHINVTPGVYIIKIDETTTKIVI